MKSNLRHGWKLRWHYMMDRGDLGRVSWRLSDQILDRELRMRSHRRF